MKYTLQGVTAEHQTVTADSGVNGAEELDRWARSASEGVSPLVWVIDQQGIAMTLDFSGAKNPANWSSGEYKLAAMRVTAEADSADAAALAFASLFTVRETNARAALDWFNIRLNEKYGKALAGAPRKVRCEITVVASQDAGHKADRDGLSRYVAEHLHLTAPSSPVHVTVHVPVALGANASNWKEGE
jgi:hypothetical protein